MQAFTSAMSRLEALVGDTRVLLQLLRGMPEGGAERERLDRFYAPQARRYDIFRSRLLHGREILLSRLALKPGDRVIELGGGTGVNLELLGGRLGQLGSYEIVDLCPALLSVARERSRHLSNVRVIEADARDYQPYIETDFVIASYSLSMMTGWREAIGNALAMLKCGGTLAVVDFYVPARETHPGRLRIPTWQSLFWSRWFAHDGVRLDPDTPEHLMQRMPRHVLVEETGSVPYLPGMKVPYYLFLGRKEGG